MDRLISIGSIRSDWKVERLEMARKRIVGEAPLTDRIVTTPENLLLLPSEGAVPAKQAGNEDVIEVNGNKGRRKLKWRKSPWGSLAADESVVGGRGGGDTGLEREEGEVKAFSARRQGPIKNDA